MAYCFYGASFLVVPSALYGFNQASMHAPGIVGGQRSRLSEIFP
jgi:hypothetical protein